MFGKNAKVDLELNRDVEQLIKTGGKEKLLPIVQAGEPVLRQRTVAYHGQLSKRTLAKLIDTMHTTMLEAPGVGLAATQIGLGLALAVVEDHVRDDEDDPREIAEFPFHVIINPSYKPTSDKTASFYEGCLSFDGYQAGLLARLTQQPYVAHNATFEHSWFMLNVAGYAESYRAGRITIIDTLPMSRQWDPGAVPTNEHPYGDNTLDAYAKRQGALDSAHNERHLGLEDSHIMLVAMKHHLAALKAQRKGPWGPAGRAGVGGKSCGRKR